MPFSAQKLIEPLGQIFLVGVDAELVDQLNDRLSRNLEATRIEEPDDLFDHLEGGGVPIDSVVLGLAVDDAARMAQRIHAYDKLVPIVILSAPSTTEILRRALMFNPFLGSDVSIWSTDDLDILPASLHQSVARRRQRLAYRNTLSKAQIRLEKFPLQQPEATHYLDRLLDHAPVGVVTIDLNGTVITLNQLAQQILVENGQDLLGQPLVKFFPSGERDRLIRLQHQVTDATTSQCSDVFELPRRKGSTFFVEITAAALAYRTGQRGLMLILQDVTSRIRAEREQQRAEEELRLHAEVLREFHEIASSEHTDLDDKLDRVLALGCRQFGLPTGVLTRVEGDALHVIRSVGDIDSYPSGSQHDVEQTYCGVALYAPEPLVVAHAAQENWADHPAYRSSQLESYIGTAVQIEKDEQGTLCFLGDRPRSKPFVSADSELVKLMARWVTNELQREHAESLMRTQSGALERTADAIMITDQNRYIEYVNPSFEHLTGYSKEEVVGHKAYFLRSGLHDQKFYDELWNVIGKGKAYRGRLVNRKKDGTLYHEQKTISPVKDENGKITHFISVGHDITDLVEAEEKNRAHQAELSHVARLSTLGEMTSGLAHELNQPLCAITTYAQGCLHVIDKDECDPEQVRYGLQQVVKQANLASAIFQRLRNFARKREIQRIAIDIDQIIDEVVEFVAAEAQQKHVRLERSSPPAVETVYADPIQVEQVLLNLVRNAIDSVTAFEQDRRRIALNVLDSDEDWLTVEIQDSGGGCPLAMVDRLFEPFVTSKKKGLGIGLSISHGIIEAHGGSLWLAENSDHGAVFRFTLPTGNNPSEQSA